MADQNFVHTAEIMKAAIPYVNSRSRVMVEFFTKAIDFMGTFRSVTTSNNMAACGFENDKTDVEGLLTGIRPLCNKMERDMIDRILNIFNAKRMFEMYNTFMSTMNTMQEFGGFPFGDSQDGNSSIFENMGNFSGYSFDSIFGNQNSSSDNKSTVHKADEETADHDSEAKASDYVTDYEAEPGLKETTTEDHDEDPNTEANKSSENNNTNDASTGGLNMNNNSMFEMLKTMVPPEQMSTFENLSMLFKTMSYDNNKPDVGKE